MCRSSGTTTPWAHSGILPNEAIEGRGLAHGFKWHDAITEATARIVSPHDVNARLWDARENARALAAILEGREDDLDGWLSNDVVGSLNEALAVFSVRVMTGGEFDSNPPIPSAYSVAALQAANDIAVQAEVHVCANEKCGRKFTRQRGRSDYGEYRTKGVLYCSKSCALAQAQRDRRRRLKTAAQQAAETGN